MAFDKFNRGKQLCYDGDLTSGLELISQALRLRPKEPTFLSVKAFFLCESKEFKKSIEMAEKALRLKSKDVRANNVVFESSLKIGDTKKCHAHLSKMQSYRCSRQAKVLMKIPEKTKQLKDYCAKRGNLKELLESNNAEEVIKDAEKCLRIGTYDTTVLSYKLEALLLQGRHNDVCKTYNDVRPYEREMESFSKLTEVLGRSFVMQDRYQDAKELNFSLSEMLNEILGLKSQASDCLKARQSDLALLNANTALLKLKEFPLKNLALEGELRSLQLEARLIRDRVDVTIGNIELAVQEVDGYINQKKYSFASARIRDMLKIIKSAVGELPENLSLTFWKRRLDDVQDAVRVSQNSKLWSRTRALLALKTNGNDIKQKYNDMAKRYHPDKHTQESQGWQDLYKMLTQEVCTANEYLKTQQSSDKPIQVNIQTGFRWSEKQKEFIAKMRKRAGQQ